MGCINIEIILREPVSTSKSSRNSQWYDLSKISAPIEQWLKNDGCVNPGKSSSLLSRCFPQKAFQNPRTFSNVFKKSDKQTKRLNNNCLKRVFILRILNNKVTTPPSGLATGPGEASAKWDRAPASSSREKFTAVRPGRRARWALDGLSFAARPRRKAAYVAIVYGFHVQYRGCNDNVIQHNKTAIFK